MCKKKQLSLPERVLLFCQKHALCAINDSLLIACSGGVDSMVLAEIIYSLQSELGVTKIALAHLNHEWRKEAYQDQAIVEQWARTRNVPCFVATRTEIESLLTYKSANDYSEAYGRKLRQAFLEDIKNKHGFTSIATAHHADDVIETFLIRCIRGSSISGINGLRPKQENYIRPLLEINKQELYAYASSRGIPFVEDASNANDRYLRNRLRNNVIPALEKADQRSKNGILKTLASLDKTEEYITRVINTRMAEIGTWCENTYELSLPAFRECDVYEQELIVHTLLSKTVRHDQPTQQMVAECIRFLHYPAGGRHAVGTVQITKKKSTAWWSCIVL